MILGPIEWVWIPIDGGSMRAVVNRCLLTGCCIDAPVVVQSDLCERHIRVKNRKIREVGCILFFILYKSNVLYWHNILYSYIHHMNSAIALLEQPSANYDIDTLASAIARDLTEIAVTPLKPVSLDHDRYDDQSHLVESIDWTHAEELYQRWRTGWDISLESPFFLQYCSDTLPISRYHSENDTLAWFLDAISHDICETYRNTLREQFWEKPYDLSYTSTFFVAQETRPDNPYNASEILDEYIRYFIIERGLSLPDISYESLARSYTFADHADDYQRWMEDLLGIPPVMDIPHIPATRFIRALIEKYAYRKDLTFILANGIGFYLWHNGKYISKKEFREMISPFMDDIGKYRNSTMWGMFRTEVLLSFGIGNLLHRLDISTDPVGSTILRGVISGWWTKWVDMCVLPSGMQREDIVPSILANKSIPDIRIPTQQDIHAQRINRMQQDYISNLHHISSWVQLRGTNSLVPFLFEWYQAPKISSEFTGKISDILWAAKSIEKNIQIRNNAIQKYRVLMDPMASLHLQDTSTIWGKIHFYSEPSTEQLAALGHIMPRGGFSLIHANMTLNLPPCQSPIELVCVLYKLQQIGVIRDSDLDIQLSIPSRLPEHLCAILGSAMIFLKSYQVEYPVEAFHTTHDKLTGACIVAYDAWVLDKSGFSNLDTSWEWRTDVLGIKKIEEVFVYHVLGELLRWYHMQSQYSEAGSEFIHGYRAILESYGMADILDQKWVHNPTNPALMTPDEYKKHPKLVQRCTDILNKNIDTYNQTGNPDGLMIFEIQELFARIAEKYSLAYDFPRILRVVNNLVPIGDRTQVLL